MKPNVSPLYFVPVLSQLITKTICFCLLFCISSIYGAPSLSAQTDPDDILIGDRKIPDVLLVGTFHFGYPNLDAYKVAEDKQVDILSAEKQLEVEALVEYLAKFRPTKIVVEAGRNTGYLMRKYERWQAGSYKLEAREIDQLAFRLMQRFQLDTIYGCDASGLTYDMEQSADSLVFNSYLEEIFEDYDWQSDDPMDVLYGQLYDQMTELSIELPLLDYFKYLNSDQLIERMHGAYLIGDFKLENNKGADALAIYWYSRNLRIVRRIQQLEAGPDDRVLVLFGAGHIGILEQQFSASPEFELVKFNELNKR